MERGSHNAMDRRIILSVRSVSSRGSGFCPTQRQRARVREGSYPDQEENHPRARRPVTCGTGAGARADVWPSNSGQGRTTGAVGRGEQARRADGQVSGRADERTGSGLGGRQQQPGDHSVVCGREKAEVLFYIRGAEKRKKTKLAAEV